jgi:CBS domain-containing protein
MTTTSTFERIDDLAGAGGLFDQEFADSLKEAFQFLMELRLEGRLRKNQVRGEGADNYVRADDLSKLQHDALKDSLLIVKEFKQLVSHHFKLSSF